MPCTQEDALSFLKSNPSAAFAFLRGHFQDLYNSAVQQLSNIEALTRSLGAMGDQVPAAAPVSRSTAPSSSAAAPTKAAAPVKKRVRVRRRKTAEAGGAAAPSPASA